MALLKRVEELAEETEELAEEFNNLFNVIPSSTLARVALPVHPGVLKIAKSVWQTPSYIPPTSKKVENKYYVLAKRFEYLYAHPPAGSLVVSIIKERDRQVQASGTPKNKDARRLDLFGRKVYSVASLQVWVSNHQALLGRFNFNLWDSISKFKEGLPQDQAQEFATFMDAGKEVTRGTLQMAWEATVSAARMVISAVVMRWSSWLQCSRLSQEMQTTLQDLPFEGEGLLELTDAQLHCLKDSRATLWSLGLHTPQQIRKPFQPLSPLPPSRSWGIPQSISYRRKEKVKGFK
ncbi:hypothetical protein UY3_07161 [Chelonia mydas]|uniref:Lamina-associated polypeptide 2 alpha C-terminal domain-containing protein n=1 Tax=Chelonia mydas TaxID=8469 RepID=M7BJ19_CHEMY|nr:hypothetical protein UY3_07161 [Chelonia mydas]